jgi:hypothetical protein
LVTETATSTLISTTTLTVTIASADPSTRSITIQTPIPTIKADVSDILNGKSMETKVSIGENDTKDGTMVKTETGERSSCDIKTGILGKVLTKTIYCVDDEMHKTEILKKLRIEGKPAPSWAKPHEKKYVEHEQYTPFIEDIQVGPKSTSPQIWYAWKSYYGNDDDTRSLSEMMITQPEVFNKGNYFRYMELSSLPRGSSSWGGLRYTPSAEEALWYKIYEGQANPKYTNILPSSDMWNTYVPIDIDDKQKITIDGDYGIHKEANTLQEQEQQQYDYVYARSGSER